MRYLKKWYVILLAVFIVEIAFESCTRHYRYKRMIKRRRTAISKRYHSPYQKKLKKNIIPINKNYIIKNKQNRRGVPTASKRK
ncbi:MAG: hypothetical protein PHR81_09675 [Bacteroidales bacterium]|jgi:hypothetical protein|nr:hypothetical protein [Bacteroidales bacterium]MDD4215068.1 hypothetical protein [Bacteroidales bacterium]